MSHVELYLFWQMKLDRMQIELTATQHQLTSESAGAAEYSSMHRHAVPTHSSPDLASSLPPQSPSASSASIAKTTPFSPSRQAERQVRLLEHQMERQRVQVCVVFFSNVFSSFKSSHS
jgi:hypothetical protein